MTVNNMTTPSDDAGDTSRNTPRPVVPRRALLVAVALVLSAGAVLAQVLQQPTPPVPAPVVRPPPPVAPAIPESITVQRGDIVQSVNAAGKLQLYKYADANAQLAGQIKDVLVAVGDTVKAGALVVEITPTLQPAKAESNRAQMARLEAELADQRAQMDFAELQFKRQTQLKAQNATREENFESSRMSMSSASARVDSINAQIRQVEATLKMDIDSRQHTQVIAPIAGTVVALNARPGQLVSVLPAPAPLIRIADLTKMTVQARVAEVDVTLLRRGMTATFTTPGYPGQRWAGKLRQVLPVPADGSGEHGKQAFYNVLFEVDNKQQELMSGMSAQVRFLIASAKDAVLLPLALLGTPDEDDLYSVNLIDAQGKIEERKIKIGMQNKQQVQILSGLAAGDKVLTGPPPKPVQAKAPAPAPAQAAAALKPAVSQPAPQVKQ
jgi:macrolide-specific efflux system membrane fusion protein